MTAASTGTIRWSMSAPTTIGVKCGFGTRNRTRLAFAPIWCADLSAPGGRMMARSESPAATRVFLFSVGRWAVRHPLAFPVGGHMVRALEHDRHQNLKV